MVASTEDASYRAFIQNPGYLRTILAISEELNYILGRIFTVDPNRRITLPELRRAIMACSHFTPQEPATQEVATMDPVPCTAAFSQQDMDDHMYDSSVEDDSEDDSDGSDTSSTFSYPDSDTSLSSRGSSPDLEEIMPAKHSFPESALYPLNNPPIFADPQSQLQHFTQQLPPVSLGTPPMDAMSIPGQGPSGQIFNTIPHRPLPRATMNQFQNLQQPVTPPPSPPLPYGHNPCGPTQTFGMNPAQRLPLRPATHVPRPQYHLPPMTSQTCGLWNLPHRLASHFPSYTPVY